ncbi:MAG: hydrogenase maturation protease [Anaerolineaceae bacterium]|nr:hydrogenase maturation protease [Anaerolineaceae bacterium]
MPVQKTLVIGLGNPLLGDDGVGWVIAERLREVQLLPLDVEIDTLALGGIGLMERLVGYQRAVIIDALKTGHFPNGSVHSFRLDDLENQFAGHLASAHETNLQTALEMGRELGADLPSEVLVVAIESPYIYDFSEQLSPEVASAVEKAAQLVSDLLADKKDQEE